MEALGLVEVSPAKIEKAYKNFKNYLQAAQKEYSKFRKNYSREFSWWEKFRGVDKLSGEDLYKHDFEANLSYWWNTRFDFAKVVGFDENYCDVLAEYGYYNDNFFAIKNIVETGEPNIYLSPRLCGWVNKWVKKTLEEQNFE